MTSVRSLSCRVIGPHSSRIRRASRRLEGKLALVPEEQLEDRLVIDQPRELIDVPLGEQTARHEHLGKGLERFCLGAPRLVQRLLRDRTGTQQHAGEGTVGPDLRRPRAQHRALDEEDLQDTPGALHLEPTRLGLLGDQLEDVGRPEVGEDTPQAHRATRSLLARWNDSQRLFA